MALFCLTIMFIIRVIIGYIEIFKAENLENTRNKKFCSSQFLHFNIVSKDIFVFCRTLVRTLQNSMLSRCQQSMHYLVT